MDSENSADHVFVDSDAEGQIPIRCFVCAHSTSKPHTTYYYKVDSEDAKGNSDGVRSPVGSFTTQ